MIAYDVRGAGASDAPRRRADYALERLAADLKAVADATCGGRPFISATTGGRSSAGEAVTDPFAAGSRRTRRSRACLDHVFRAKMRLKQSLKSWYIAFFHLPLVPSLVWRLGGAALVAALAAAHRARACGARSVQLKNALNGLQLYRANFIARVQPRASGTRRRPMQILVPVRDRYVTPRVGRPRPLARRPRARGNRRHALDRAAPPDMIASRIDRFASAQGPAGTRPGRGPGSAQAGAGAGRRLNSIS